MHQQQKCNYFQSTSHLPGQSPFRRLHRLSATGRVNWCGPSRNGFLEAVVVVQPPADRTVVFTALGLSRCPFAPNSLREPAKPIPGHVSNAGPITSDCGRTKLTYPSVISCMHSNSIPRTPGSSADTRLLEGGQDPSISLLSAQTPLPISAGSVLGNVPALSYRHDRTNNGCNCYCLATTVSLQCSVTHG